MVSEQGNHGKNIFKDILVHIREVNLKASERKSGREFENENRKPNSILG